MKRRFSIGLRGIIQESPWSVPRLRGRGEQGKTLWQAYNLAALCRVNGKDREIERRQRFGGPLPFPFADHGLASEARSTKEQAKGVPRFSPDRWLDLEN